MNERLLTIGVFARRSRLSLKALRLYERLGLLTPSHVDPRTGYRRYREEQLFTARLIVGLRRLDMPLSEIAKIVYAPGDAGARLLDGYWHEVQRRVAVQGELAHRLRDSLLGADDRFAAFHVCTRDVPEQSVLSIQRSVDLNGLPQMIGDSIRDLLGRAEGHGGVTGEHFIVFHGEVNEDSDGPVEVCVPVAAGAAESRSEPAHQEAFVTVTKAQLEWPQILSAYDAVDQWIEVNSLICAGSPREVYRNGVCPRSAESTDEICDIAFPIAPAS